MLTTFEQKVLSTIKLIPTGKVSTYREVARAIGRAGSARAVGNALNKNPDAPRVPCHRIVKSNGELGGYAGGEKRKIALLAKEGVVVRQGRINNLKDVFYKF